MDRCYVIKLEQPWQIVEVSVTYSLETHSVCQYDFLEINNDGQKYCGNGSVTKRFSVLGRDWVIRFVTDYSVTLERGFVIDYRVV